MKQVRLTVTADGQDWKVTATSPNEPTFAPPARVLTVATAGGYPRPPAAESARATGQPWAALVSATDAELRRRQQDILFGDVTGSDVSLFGSYMFETLVGATWDDVVTAFPNEDIDIEIDLPPNAAQLQALPWELMFSNGQPLVARAPGTVSITRLIAPAAATESTRLDIPIRLLFVVGRLDEKLRPGAEYLGLLRQLGSHVAGAATAVGPLLRARIIVEASTVDIAEAVEAFKPNVVHVVAHGRHSNNDPELLLAAVAGNTTVDAPCNPPQLIAALRGTSNKLPLPHLVIVNACETANPGDHLSYAADLVTRGVAASIGMSGEVQDAACRIFTAFFYRKLAEPGTVAQATASGQRAALLHYAHYQQSVEWARPALFLAKDVQTQLGTDHAAIQLGTFAAQARGSNPPSICGRYRQLRSYATFAGKITEPGAARLLVFEQSTDGTPHPLPGGYRLDYMIGKTRFLEDLVWMSILDELVPCALPAYKGRTIAANFLQFALLLADAMDTARGHFGVPPRIGSAVQRLAFDACGQDSKLAPDSEEFETAFDKVRKRLPSLTVAEQPEPDTVAARLRRDIETLLDDVRAVRPTIRGALVLIDDLHRYEGVYEDILSLVGQYGLGTADAPAPVIATYSPKRNAGLDVRTLITDGARSVAKWTVIQSLEPFSTDPEGQIAYAQYLHTRKRMPKRGQQGRDGFKDFVLKADVRINGVPGWLEVLDWTLDGYERVLAPIDDEAILTAMTK